MRRGGGGRMDGSEMGGLGHDAGPFSALATQISRGSLSQPTLAQGEADAQLRRYLADEKLRAMSGGKPWRAVSIAFAGTEACWFRALDGEAQRVES